MRWFVLGFHLGLGGRMQELSLAHPDVEWSARPLGGRWLAEGHGPGAAGPADRPARSTLLVPRSAAEKAFLDELEGWGAAALPPLRWNAGRLSVRLLAPTSSPPARWRRRHPDAVLVLKRSMAPAELPRESGTTPRWDLGLSGRQREVLGRAVRDGYYDVPRRTTVARIARGLGLGRSTVEEHLRIAESTLVRASAPLAGLPDGSPEDGSAPGADAWRTFAMLSSELDLYVWMVLHGDRIARVTLARSAPPARYAASHPYLYRIVRHVATGKDDLRDLPIELGLSRFDRRVLEEVRRVPPGRTATYREIAGRVGRPGAARAVGNALARNPTLVVVPCHRIVPSAGGIGQYSGQGGARTKRRLLEREGARVADP